MQYSTRLMAMASSVALLSACSSEPDGTENVASGGDSSEAQQLFAAFMAEEGENIEQCFAEMPEMETGVSGGDMVGADNNAETPPTRVIMAIDASGSMAGRFGGQTKMSAAKSSAQNFLARLPDSVDVGLLAFGHRGSNDEAGKMASCAAVETIFPLGQANGSELRASLDRFRATGWTPLASAIRTAGASFSSAEDPGTQVVYVVSDGEETCGGDPVAAARSLHEGGIRAIVNVIGFDLAERDREQLRAVASAGGGTFVEVGNSDEMQRLFERLRARTANASTMARNAAQTGSAIARNTARTGSSVARMKACVGSGVARERSGFYGWARDRELQSSLREEVSSMLRRQHDEFKSRANRIQDRVEAERDAANEIQRQDREQTRSRYDEARESLN
ncbi:MAG: VWA domain-containing protein [Alteraurantiacibacter sp.]